MLFITIIVVVIVIIISNSITIFILHLCYIMYIILKLLLFSIY